MKVNGFRSAALLLCGSSLLTLASVSSHAAVASASFDQLAGSVAQGTTVFRADLSGLGLNEIVSLTLSDSNSGRGGSSGAFSGFDLDAIKISTTLANSAAEAQAALGLWSSISAPPEPSSHRVRSGRPPPPNSTAPPHPG